MAEMLRDQYAFRPTGSTTAALIDLLQKVTDMLQQHEYVVLFTVDFSKAFDSVKHQSVFEKMESLQLPDHIHNWLVRYFESCGHVTRLGDIISTRLQLHSSTLQSFRGQVSDHHRMLSLPPIFVRAIRKTE